MVRRILAGIGVSVVASTLAYAQGQAPPPAGGRGGAAPKLPTEAQWAAMSPKAKEYVDKARAIAGKDPDLVFDFGIFCKASGGSQNEDRATVGVPESEPKLRPYPAPTPPKVIGGQRLFDNFYWIGNTGIGAWLITSNDGYILFDTMNSEEDARDIIIPAIKKLNLDPMKIKYLVFGHNHFDHTGGGEYIQRMTGAKAVMHRDDWEIYMKSTGRGGGGGRGGRGGAAAPAAAPAPPPAPTPKMKRDIDATDGMKITVGDVTGTIFTMTGHTPGSIGMVVPVKWQGTTHPILLVTAGTDVQQPRRLRRRLRAHLGRGHQDESRERHAGHPNTNMNLLARTTYVHDSYPPAKNPLLYGPDRTERYINIMRNCTLARMEILGW
jgi:metallo-beta-lactamase class B